MATAVLATVLGVAGSAGTAGQGSTPIESRLDQLFGSHESYRRFLQDLQGAFAAHDRTQIAAMINYPFRTHLGGHDVKLDNPRHFLAHFEELLPQSSLDAITGQSYAELFANAQGVMIGSGEVWFSAVCAARNCNAPPVLIIALNPRPPAVP